MMVTDRALLRSVPLTTIELVQLIATGHPLATIAGPIATMVMNSAYLADRALGPAGTWMVE